MTPFFLSFFILNQVNNNRLQQHLNWCSTRCNVCYGWLGHATDWTNDAVSNRKNPTQVQEKCQILLQWSCAQAVPLRISRQKEKCFHCGKTTNQGNSLEKHLRSCEKAPIRPVKQQLPQTMLYGLNWSKNGPLTPKKLMVEGVWVGGAPTEHAEHWKAPEIVESALKYTAITFRKTFDSNNKRDVLQHLKDVIHSMRPIIDGQTLASAEVAKWCLSLNMNFCKSTSPGVKMNPTVTIHSEMFKSIGTHELVYQFPVGYNLIVQQIDESQRNGSGWLADHL